MAVERIPPVKRPNPGSRGGIVSSLRLSPEQRAARSSNAGNATLRRFGIGYYSALGRASRQKQQEALT